MTEQHITTYRDLRWRGTRAEGIRNLDGECRAFSGDLDTMLIRSASEMFPGTFADLKQEYPHRRITLARYVLRFTVIPFVAGFFVDIGVSSNRWDTKLMHRQCYADMNDEQVERGMHRTPWLDVVTAWRDDQVCAGCGQVTPKGEKA